MSAGGVDSRGAWDDGLPTASAAVAVSTRATHASAAAACLFPNLPISVGSPGTTDRPAAAAAARSNPSAAHSRAFVPGSGSVAVPSGGWVQSSRSPVVFPWTVQTGTASHTDSVAAA